MFDLTDPAYNAFTKTQRYDEFGNISLAAPRRSKVWLKRSEL